MSHAAPTHHFGDKAGLLTVLATQGFHLFADNLGHIREQTGSLLEIGVGYVRFAVEYRAHFEVMFRPELYHRDDPLLVAAKQRATDELQAGVATLGEPPGDERDPGSPGWPPGRSCTGSPRSGSVARCHRRSATTRRR